MMSEFYNNLVWSRLRDQIGADFEAVTKAVIEAVPALYRRYEFNSNQQCPIYAHAIYKNLDNKKEHYLVLAVSMFVRSDKNILAVHSDLDRDNLNDDTMILPHLPDRPWITTPLPSLRDKSQAEIEALFDVPSVVSLLDEMMVPIHSFLRSKELVNAIIMEETTRWQV